VTVQQVIAGLLMVAAALYDMFHTLFHPSARGALSEWISLRMWRFWRRIYAGNHSRLSLSGPLSFVLIVVAWGLLLVLGFALVYHPFLVTEFVTAPGIDLAQHHTFFDAFNLSLGSLITLSGDFNTKSHWLKLAMGVEALMGFALLTSSLSWVLSIYPVLENRRSVAHRLSLLYHAQQIERVGLASIPDQHTERLVMQLAIDMTRIRNDLAQFPITYYFHEDEQQSAFAGALPLAWDIAKRAAREESTEPVRIAGIVLEGAIHDLLCLIGVWFLSMDDEQDDEKLLAAISTDHFRQEIRSA
jgi:hypothetical protein